MTRSPTILALASMLTLTALASFQTAVVQADDASAQADENILYNGIQLRASWPPNYAHYTRADHQSPGYLQRPPEVIKVDVGRQLFVDDFLIETTTLSRQFHQPTLFDQNPILKAEHPATEIGGIAFPNAAPFSDGVWWDPADKLFKMWYLARNGVYTSYVTSEDGIHWKRPNLPGSHVKGANTVLKNRGDSSTVWMDLETGDPKRKFQMLTWRANRLHFRISKDGLDWGDPIWSATRVVGDRTTCFYNPFRKKWVFSIRASDRNLGRVRHYLETDDLANEPQFRSQVPWIRADGQDRVREESRRGAAPELYNLDATPYESLMLGLFTILSVDHNEYPGDPSHPKVNHVSLGYSRDGFHWTRPDRRPFLDIAENSARDKTAWNRGNVQSVGGGCLIVGDRLHFYFSGRNSRKETDDGSGMATGLAFLRRDGFASMDAGDESDTLLTGTLLTRPIVFQGTKLFVNVDNPDGELKVEVFQEDGTTIHSLTAEQCVGVSEDSTMTEIRWKNADLSKLAGKPVRLKFHLRNGSLYSFWFSDDSGASHGYVAAGGPGFTSNKDTVGHD